VKIEIDLKLKLRQRNRDKETEAMKYDADEVDEADKVYVVYEGHLLSLA
jgi:hypothetical protein